MACYGNIVYGPTAGDAVPNTTTNAVLPTTGKPKLVITPEYADDGVTIMYYNYEVAIDVLLYLDVSIVGSDIEAEVARLRDILSTVGHPLKIYPVGLGTIPTIVTDTPDLKGGPYPQEVVVEPVVTNNAILVHWKVLARISHCPSLIRQAVQFNSEFDIEVDDDGDVTFALQVTYQRRDPITDVGSLSTLADALIQNPGKVFQGMQRRKRTSFSRDMRIAHITIQYRSIKSDSAFYPWTRNIDLIDDLSSDLMSQGFTMWDRRISCTINLPPRIHKAWAWVVFRKILAERFRNLKQLTKAAALLGVQAAANQEADLNRQKNWFLLTKIHLVNPVYTRQMKFELTYVVCTDLPTLLAKTLITSRVNPSTGKLSDQWKAWDATSNRDLSGYFGFESSGPIFMTPCVSFPSGTTVGATATPIDTSCPIADRATIESDPDSGVPAPVSPTDPCNTTGGAISYQNYPDSSPINSAYSWIKYKNEFQFLETNDNVQISYLQDTDATYYQNPLTIGPLKETAGFQMDQILSNTDSGKVQPETVRRGISTFKVRMTGFAIRAGFAIPIPVLTSIGGNVASRTGEQRVTHEQIAQSDSTPIYLAQWDILYNIDGNFRDSDIQSQIKTTGAPGYFGG